GFPPLRVTYLSLTDNGVGCLFNNSISGKSTTGALEVKVGRAGVPHMLSIVCPANSGEDGFLSTFSEAGVLDTYERGYPKWRAEDRFRFEDPPLVGTGLDPLGGINSATLLEEMGDLNWAAIEINRKPSWKGKHSVDDDVIRAQGPTEAKTADGLGKYNSNAHDGSCVCMGERDIDRIAAAIQLAYTVALPLAIKEQYSYELLCGLVRVRSEEAIKTANDAGREFELNPLTGYKMI
ncbi:hypothetical protein FOZ63_032106, partial [Perkinsus olseni]